MSWRLKEEEALSSGLRPEDLATALKVPLWTAKVLFHRMRHWGDQSLEAVKRFIDPSLKYLPDPFLLPDMDQAAERLAEAIVEGQKIAIYGDYDVDGTVGTALMRRFLRGLGSEPIVYQPDRQKDGYGVNKSAIEMIAGLGAQLLLTVDCGITSVAEVERANELGMEVIICDHHEPKEILPPAYAVLDHKRLDNEGPIRSLSGAGVAFYLAIATRSILRDIGHFGPDGPGVKEPDIRDLLDLAALATVADMVPLVDENRIIVKFGLEKLRKSPSVGLREMLRVAGVKQEEVSTYHLGFILGPRINASGRLGSANSALELLSTDDPVEATKLAERLQGVNEERMRVQGEVAEAALAQAEKRVAAGGDKLAALVLDGADWHEGVIGIVASKVVERFHRPVAIITFGTHSGLGKGSVRGFSKLDMLAALEACSEHLKSFGGHKAAAGLSVEAGKLEAFREAFAAAVAAQVQAISPGESNLLPKEVVADARIENEDELSNQTVAFLESLSPFGMGNSEPIIVISGWKVAGMRTLKERHLKIQFTTAQNKSLEGFWANGQGKIAEEETGEVDIVCYPQINSFRNLNRLELKIKDIRARSN
ncbi:MAG: single-stranded-DNA-specific exonuclease RecJ [Bdellovibrionota bacterium]